MQYKEPNSYALNKLENKILAQLQYTKVTNQHASHYH